METLYRSRCINHEGREAVARCPECGHFFCRECITEHDGMVICAVCLQHRSSNRDESEPQHRMAHALERFALGLKFICGLFVFWLVLYAIGQVLISIPEDFHSGKIWSEF
ncbi:MAG: hypothetical protein JXR25_14380 [Pontiellaceae bacterium]|nr:hypothetical protein [Pontiellaceae bacterium]MBN2786006.1 hypothetical protein [Pontiellaceae bacterium]